MLTVLFVPKLIFHKYLIVYKFKYKILFVN